MRKYNTWVSIYYKGSLLDGSIFDDHSDGEPLKVIIGSESLPKGLEDAIIEMELNEERVIEISPDEGFGHHDPEGVFKIPSNSIPDYKKMPVGEYILWYGELKKNNVPTLAKVVSVDDAQITLDLNHPLADKKTSYWIKIVDEGIQVEQEIDDFMSQIKRQAEKEKQTWEKTLQD